MRFSTSDQLDALVDSLKTRIPEAQVNEREASSAWPTRTLTLTRSGLSSEKVHLMEYMSGIEVHFGHDLTIELSTRNEEEVKQTFAELAALLAAILLEGFSETLWMKNGEVVQAEAVLMYGGTSHPFRTRGLARIRGSEVISVRHGPWMEPELKLHVPRE